MLIALSTWIFQNKEFTNAQIEYNGGRTMDTGIVRQMGE